MFQSNFNISISENHTAAPTFLHQPVFTPMTKASTKKRPNRKHAPGAVAATKKRLSLGNSRTSKLHKKTRKNVSHQQTIQARDTLDAEYRDWRSGMNRSTVTFLATHPLV